MVDEALLKDKANEDYWTDYRDTPKAFITLAAGQDMWSSRFGALTSIRLPGAEYGVESASQLITSRIAPDELGYFFESAREKAISSAETSMDLGQLFGSMSFFLILAAITLTVLLFSFGVDQRSKEIGTLLALGFTTKRLRLMFLLESGILSAVGSGTGAFAGIHYTRLLLWGLREKWSGAVANAAIEFYAAPASPFIGAVIGFVITMIVIAFALRSKLRKQIAPHAEEQPVLVVGPEEVLPVVRVPARLRGVHGNPAVIPGMELRPAMVAADLSLAAPMAIPHFQFNQWAQERIPKPAQASRRSYSAISFRKR